MCCSSTASSPARWTKTDCRSRRSWPSPGCCAMYASTTRRCTGGYPNRSASPAWICPNGCQQPGAPRHTCAPAGYVGHSRPALRPRHGLESHQLESLSDRTGRRCVLLSPQRLPEAGSTHRQSPRIRANEVLAGSTRMTRGRWKAGRDWSQPGAAPRASERPSGRKREGGRRD